MDHAGLMLFQQRFWEPIQSGRVTITFRRWKRAQVVADRTYRSSAGRLHVERVAIVDPADITDADAGRAGFESAAALVDDLRGRPDDAVYRIEFRYLDEPDPRDVLAADDRLDDAAVAEIDRRLDRYDSASAHGPWTHAYLATIAANPGVRAPDLAARFARDTQPFKTDVRKLKNLGLTISLNPGYRLSPRGAAYLTRTDREPEAPVDP